jgi:hypothetical protein
MNGERSTRHTSAGEVVLYEALTGTSISMCAS